MPTVYLATLNPHKVQELLAMAQQLGHPQLDFKPASQIEPGIAWDETGVTFVDNARIKALAVLAALRRQSLADVWVLADDSGLSVDALAGAPGVHSARYAGPHATTAENNAKLLTELNRLKTAGPRLFPARFTCALYFIDAEGREQSFVGLCEGHVTTQTRGHHGFGYDPMFIVDGMAGRTMAELTESEKNRVSHRRRALDQWLKFIS